jgi:hypothetical protein
MEKPESHSGQSGGLGRIRLGLAAQAAPQNLCILYVFYEKRQKAWNGGDFKIAKLMNSGYAVTDT